MIQKSAAFPISLIFPPQGHFTQPYLALPCLKAWLEQHGFGDVALVDASIEAYDHFLSPDELSWAAERVAEKLPLDKFGESGELRFDELEGYRAAAESAVSASALIAGIDEAKRIVRGEDFYEPDAYLPAMRSIYHGLRLFSAAHFPSQLTPHNFTMRLANDRSEEVLAATLNEDENPFIRFFRERVLPGLIERKPRLVGLSVIYGSQLIPALTLGRMIKAALPDCHITAGGGFLAYIGKKLLAAPGVDACLDSLIFHEGEAPMLALANALQAGESLSTIGSLDWYDRSSGSAVRVENPQGHPIRLEDAPTPSFDGLPFEKYFSPEVVIPYDINRGCYYGECAFCTLPTVIGPGYRTRSAKKIVDHVMELSEKLGTRNVNFITDCMPPGMIADLPNELIERKANLRWWCDARVEPKAYTPEGARNLHAAGCRKLLFGFETATPRLLKLMKKGQSARATLDVARNCTDAGISVTFYAMVGFPSETREEARATLDFIRSNSDVVREVSLQTFHIDEVAQTYKDAEAFGIEILDDEHADLQLYHDYVSESGMTQTEAAEMFEEMMAAFREQLPLFSGDNIYYFMNKSHYFLHLARDVSPDEFVELCRRRTERRSTEQAVERGLAPATDLGLTTLPFRYTDVVRALAHPLARAVRPDFLTGRYVEDLIPRAGAEIGSIRPAESALAYSANGAEYTELSIDGKQVLDALSEVGSLDLLLDSLAGADERGRADLNRFAARLERAGVLSRTH